MPLTLEPGALFGRYRVLRRLAIGGMAEIWLAQAADGGKPVVLKRILPQFAQDKELLQRFEQEAELTLSLVHGNIVPVFEVGRIDNEPYMIMEYLPGHDVRAVLRSLHKKRQKAPIGVATYIGLEVLRGLTYVHAKVGPDGQSLRLIHRDVSPSNIVISNEGVVKLLDFGIAKVFGRAGATKTGILVGKVGYMSPEQVRGKRLTLQSDLFSIAVVLYELLAGARLFDGESEAEILEKVRGAPIVPLHLRNPDVPKTLEALISKGLEREPNERWESAAEFATELNTFMSQAGWPSDAAAAAKFASELFEDEQEEQDVEMGEVFHTGTATQLPDSPAPGKALQLGGKVEVGATSQPTMISPRSQGWLIAGFTLAIAVAIASSTGILPTMKLFSKPTPTPVASMSSLVISSKPQGAQIWIDGSDTGKITPAGLELDATTVEVTLKLADHIDATETVDIVRGRATTVALSLKPDYRTVSVETDPRGADVTVNGANNCSSPCKFRNLLPSQTILISASAPGFVTSTARKNVADIDGPVRLELAKREVAVTTATPTVVAGAGKISLRVRPWGYIAIDGGTESDTPLVDYALPVGKHEITVRNPELGKKLTCTFTIEADKTLRVPPIDLSVDQPRCPRLDS